MLQECPDNNKIVFCKINLGQLKKPINSVQIEPSHRPSFVYAISRVDIFGEIIISHHPEKREGPP